MPLRRTAAGAIPAAVAALLLLAATMSAVAATPQTSQATAALSYLAGQVGSDGSVASSAGTTEDTVIDAADAGYDPATLKNGSSGVSSYTYLASQRAGVTTAGGAAKMVLAWIAAGRPAAFDAQSLLDRLNTPTTSGGYLMPQGTFHNASSAVETANAYSQSLGVLADIAAHGAGLTCAGSAGACPLPANATSWLTCAQRPDGGFGYAIDDSKTPPAFCGDTSSSDTNDTGMFLQALGAAGISSANSAAEAYLHGAQENDGGFGFAPGSGSDPDSDSVVIQGLVAIGQDPTAAAWTKGPATPISNLEGFADPSTGGYILPGNSAPDPFTTAPVPQALTLKPYGAATTFTPGAAPPPAPTPTPTPTAVLVSPVSTSKIPVPATGAAPGAAGDAGLALTLLAGGSGVLLLVALVRRRRTDGPDRVP